MAYGTRRFNAAFHKGSPSIPILRHINPIIALTPISLRSILILSSHLCRELGISSFPPRGILGLIYLSVKTFFYFLLFFCRSFPEVDYYREISSHLYSQTSYLLEFLSIFPQLTSMYFLMWITHLVLGLTFGSFPSIFVYCIFLDILFSLIRISCLKHLNLLF